MSVPAPGTVAVQWRSLAAKPAVETDDFLRALPPGVPVAPLHRETVECPARTSPPDPAADAALRALLRRGDDSRAWLVARLAYGLREPQESAYLQALSAGTDPRLAARAVEGAEATAG